MASPHSRLIFRLRRDASQRVSFEDTPDINPRYSFRAAESTRSSAVSLPSSLPVSSYRPRISASSEVSAVDVVPIDESSSSREASSSSDGSLPAITKYHCAAHNQFIPNLLGPWSCALLDTLGPETPPANNTKLAKK